jgi:hypothetical protein
MKEQIQLEDNQGLVEPEVITEEVKEESQKVDDSKPEEQDNEEQEVGDYYKDKYFDTKSKVRKIYAERQKLYNENQQIKNLLTAIDTDNLRMSYSLMQSDLNEIKRHKEEAKKMQDTKYLDQAEDAYNRVLHRMLAFEKEYNHLFNEENEAKENIKDSNYNTEENESLYNDEQILAANLWLDENPELNVKSKYYNPNLEKKMLEFMDEFNDKLHEVGRGEEILSDRYIEVLNEALSHYKDEFRKPKTSYKKSGASGVRSNMATKSGDSVIIEPWERSAYQQLGLTEAEYLKSKLKHSK